MFDDTTFVEYTHSLSKIHTHTHQNTGTIERERTGEKERNHAPHAVTMLRCYDLVSKDFLDQKEESNLLAHAP
jgi:hypothetical protein